jgi:molecular chaperone GrpE (heat shock protein)
MANFYYIDADAQREGPCTGDQIQQLVQQGIITQDTLIENETGQSSFARNVKNLVFPESTQPESTHESASTDPESLLDTPFAPESLSATPLKSEQGEDISVPESVGREPSQNTAEQADILTSSVAGETVEIEPIPNAEVCVPSELNPTLDVLEGKLDSLIEKFDSLIANVDFGTKFAEKKQEQIDKLYEENQEYKHGLLDKFKKSLILAVIGQIDAAHKTISHFENQTFSEENYRKLLSNYNEIATDFQDSLAQSFDVTAFSSEENTSFDAKCQKALKTVPTEDETKHKTISKSLRQGYEIVNADETKTLLRLEMVEVYVHQPPQS